MKLPVYKLIIFLLAISFSIKTVAQKYDKKFSERFITNNDVEVKVNASNADINVTTWNKNEVMVEAVIEIEGINKKEANKYFKNYNFEAMGNKRKVEITTGRRNDWNFNDDFVLFSNGNWNAPIVHPPVVIHSDTVYYNGSVITSIPNISLKADSLTSNHLKFPKIPADVPFIDLDEIDFNYDKYEKEGKDYFFQWKDKVNDATVKTKKEWQAFKKSKQYKLFKEKIEKENIRLKKNRKKMIKEMEELKKQFYKSMEESKLKGQKAIKKIKGKLAKVYKETPKQLWTLGPKRDFIISDLQSRYRNNKKVRIKKKITIKVPKDAKFNLNTRHCKIQLPKTKTSGKVSYGTFNAKEINGGNLTIYSTNTVDIGSLNACTLFVNNSSLANISNISKATLTVNSSNVSIDKINQGVVLKNKYADAKVYNINPNFKDLTINVKNSTISLPLKKLNSNYNIDFNRSRFQFVNGTKQSLKGIYRVLKNYDITIKSKIDAPKQTNNNISLNGKYSTVTIF